MHPNGEYACPMVDGDQDAAMDVSGLSDQGDDEQEAPPHMASQNIGTPPAASQNISDLLVSQSATLAPAAQSLVPPTPASLASQSATLPPATQSLVPPTPAQSLQGTPPPESQNLSAPQADQSCSLTRQDLLNDPGSEDEFDLALESLGLPNMSAELDELTSSDLDACLTFSIPEATADVLPNTLSTAASAFAAAATSNLVLSGSQPSTAASAPPPLVQSASQPLQVATNPKLVWVKLRGFPLWPARIIEELADNLIRVKVFDKKATEVEVLHKDTKVFCRVEDLEKKITISAKHKSAWSKAYEECFNIFIEISM